MADRARHAVGGEPVVFGLAPAPIGRCAKTSPGWPPPSPWCATSACGRSSIRPRSRPAAAGWSIVSRRTAACQYGSREEFAIIDARQDTPIDTSSPDGVVSPLWHARQSCDVRNSVGVAARDRRERVGHLRRAPLARCDETATADPDGSHAGVADADMILHRVYRQPSQQATVEPVPQEVRDAPACFVRAVVERNAHPALIMMCCRRLSVTCICGTRSQ